MSITIRPYTPSDRQDFRRLNEAWISKLFAVEIEDLKVLDHPEEHILDRGGVILMAFDGDKAVGCGALLPMENHCFEIAKMAVDENLRGQGIGRRVLQRLIDLAREKGAKRLYLETNHRLENAIHLYESSGFRPVPKEKIVPSPYARADVYLEQYLDEIPLCAIF